MDSENPPQNAKSGRDVTPPRSTIQLKKDLEEELEQVKNELILKDEILAQKEVTSDSSSDAKKEDDELVGVLLIIMVFAVIILLSVIICLAVYIRSMKNRRLSED